MCRRHRRSRHPHAEGPGAEAEGVVRPRVWLGACAVDVATGQMLVGQWMDDDMRSQVRAGGGLAFWLLQSVQPCRSTRTDWG